ncbi:MAG: hypothetical protein IBJ01_08000 [Leptospira sp.]|uniref:hypothetical protein n=1 Tax=Leptospira sp. TaxID=178 RepID=UPI0025C2F112|nr:hypothetical protein [Leptospira sp.]MBL0954692.1 hypothetical protein [Leptospira sp.]
MKGNKPVSILFISVVMVFSTYLGYLGWLEWENLISIFVSFFVYIASVLCLFRILGKWLVLLSLSFVSIWVLQFAFRAELKTLKSVWEVPPEGFPKNEPRNGFEFLELDGYTLDKNLILSKAIQHKSRDAKGRDTSHTSFYEMIPLMSDKDPSEPIRFFFLDQNLFRFHNWLELGVKPRFAKILPESMDFRILLQTWEQKYPEAQKGNVVWISLYETKEDYVQSTSSFFLFLSLIPSGIWFLVGTFFLLKQMMGGGIRIFVHNMNKNFFTLFKD